MTQPADPQQDVDELRDTWPALESVERVEIFKELERDEAIEFFLSCSPYAQTQIVRGLPEKQRRLWLRLLAPDDAADVLQEVSRERRGEWLELLDEATRREVQALLAYAEDEAGGLMSPRFARVRPGMTVDAAIRYLRQQARQHLETIYYVFVMDEDERLIGVVSFRELFAAHANQTVRQIMNEDVVTVPEGMDQEDVAQLFDIYDLLALPVVDEDNHIKGIVTFDDIVDVVREEATEDVHKIGGMEALETPYLQTSLGTMLKKRGGWLTLLFVGQMFTITAMGYFEAELAEAVALALFIPLIISSGGNSGSQASTLVIRALAVGDVQRGDWWRVVKRELSSGLLLGGLLAGLGLVRVLGGDFLGAGYGEQTALLAITVGTSLIGVVTWGTVIGSTLPFLLEKLKLDPASASAPLVATLVDVFGLVIYFGVARLVMTGGVM